MSAIVASSTHRGGNGRLLIRAGWIVSGLLILILIMDAGLKIAAFAVIS